MNKKNWLSWLIVISVSACGGGGGGEGGTVSWYYHFSCNGDQACLSTNFAGTSTGTSENLGTGQGGQASCNGLMNFGRNNWNIPPAQQWCDNTSAFNPPPGPRIEVSVSPLSVTLGESATVTWSGSLVSTCNASSSWSGSKPISGSQVVTPASRGNATYGMTCTGSNGQATGAAILIVKDQPASVNLTVAPTSITLGQSATLNWTSQNIDNCTASGPWSGDKGTSGSEMVTPAAAGSFSYTIGCNGYRGPATRSVTLTVLPNGGPAPPAPPTVSISVTPASPSCLDLGSSAALAWSSSNATSCSASGAWTGPVSLSGNQSVSPAGDGDAYSVNKTFSYVLNCSGPGGSSSATATACANKSTSAVPAPTVSVSVSPSGIAAGQSATVTWSSANASYCEADGSWSGALALRGSAVVMPASQGVYSYTVRCSRNAHVASQTATLSVQIASGTDPLAARFCGVRGLSMNASNDLYISDYENFTIRRIGNDNVVSTVAGLAGSGGSDDGVGAAARFYYANGIVAGAAGNVYVSNSNMMSMRKITPDQTVTTPAGVASSTSGSSDGTGAAARFYYPFQLAADANENVYIADSGNHSIRAMTPGGTVTTFAGVSGSAGYVDGSSTAARFRSPTGITRSGADVFVVDQGNYLVRKIAADGSVTTVAGTIQSQGTTDGTGTAAKFFVPRDIAADSAGNLYVTDYVSVRKITMPGAVVSTFASFPTHVYGVTTDSVDNVYVSVTGAIYKITPGGTVSLFAGAYNVCGSNN